MQSSELESIVRHAATAPSSHNTQPWRFAVGPAHVDLRADRTRRLPVNDPHDRELTISCGCALFNLRVAAAHAGLVPSVHILPDRDDPDRLARVDLGTDGTVPSEGALFAMLGRRRTHRGAFEPRQVEEAVLQELRDAAAAEGAWLHIVGNGAERRTLAEVVAEGDAAQWSDPRWRSELARWMHARRRGDGLTVPALAAPFARLVVRSVDVGRTVASRDAELTLRAPVLAILGTAGDEQPDWLRAGQALERTLLTACSRGLQASYANQPIQVESLRPRVASLTGHAGAPQIVLRLGVPTTEKRATPRRAPDELVDHAAP